MQDNKIELNEVTRRINDLRLHYLFSGDDESKQKAETISEVMDKLRDELADYVVCFGVQGKDSKLLVLAKSDDIENAYYKLVSIDYVRKLPDEIIWTYDEFNKYLGYITVRSRDVANEAFIKARELLNLWEEHIL